MTYYTSKVVGEVRSRGRTLYAHVQAGYPWPMNKRPTWVDHFEGLGAAAQAVQRRAHRALDQAEAAINPERPLSKKSDSALKETGEAVTKAREALQAVSVAVALEARRRGMGARETGRILNTSATTVRQWETQLEQKETRE